MKTILVLRKTFGEGDNSYTKYYSADPCMRDLLAIQEFEIKTVDVSEETHEEICELNRLATKHKAVLSELFHREIDNRTFVEPEINDQVYNPDPDCTGQDLGVSGESKERMSKKDRPFYSDKYMNRLKGLW